MSLEELISIMAASIFATDERRDGAHKVEAAKDAVAKALIIWQVVESKEL